MPSHDHADQRRTERLRYAEWVEFGRAHLASDMAAPMVSPLLMLLLAGASAFAPPSAAHALLRASAAPKLSSIVMEDRVFELKIPLGDVRSWLGLGLAS